MVSVSTILSGAKRVAKVLPDLVLGNGAETAGKAIRETVKKGGSIFDAAKNGVKATEKLSVAANGAKIGFFTRMTSNLGRISSLTKAGIKAGAKKGFFGKILGGTKGFFKGLGKNMPLIGAAMTIAFEIPNIVKASKEQGIGQGVKEIGKAGARLAGGGIGAAIGSAICPGIGTMIGWIAGEWLTSKVVGKTYSEKVAEAEMAQQEAIEQQQQQQQQAGQIPFQGGQTYNPYANPTTNPYQVPNTNPMINPYATGFDTNTMALNPFPYSEDIMARNIDFNQLAQNMMTNPFGLQPQQPQPQVSQLIP